MITLGNFEFKHIEKEEHLLRNSKISKNIYFICQGKLRTYFLDTDGKPYTKISFLILRIKDTYISILKILIDPREFIIQQAQR